MKILFSVTFILALNICLGQSISFVRDSIMDSYMKSGYSNEHFRPEGEKNSAGLRHGQWKDYEVQDDFTYLTVEGKPTQLFGKYLQYGEGVFKEGRREGLWKIYVIEDMSFKRVLQQHATYVNGMKQGPFIYFFPSGKTGVEGYHISGKVDGEVKSYYEDGQLYGTRLYENGLREGRHTYLYPNGKLKFEQRFVRDTLNGLYQSYYPNGVLQETFMFKSGLVDGTYKYFYDNGQLWIETVYRDGMLMNVLGNYDSRGQARNKGTLKDGNGTVNYYDDAGKVYSVETFRNGKNVKELSE